MDAETLNTASASGGRKFSAAVLPINAAAFF
jgi:hypothetical protein